jgi:hypothetical protein
MKRLGYLGLFLLLAGVVVAQRWGRNSRFEDAHNPREIVQHSTETPTWTNTSGFEKDVVTFVRIRRDRKPYGSGEPGGLTRRTATSTSPIACSRSPR